MRAEIGQALGVSPQPRTRSHGIPQSAWREIGPGEVTNGGIVALRLSDADSRGLVRIEAEQFVVGFQPTVVGAAVETFAMASSYHAGRSTIVFPRSV